MQFGYTILYVEDVARALAFYESAFGQRRRFLHESGDFGELDTGATTLAFSSRRLMHALGKNPREADPLAPCAEIAFVTSDVAVAVARARAAGTRVLQEPQRMDWGQTVAYVADPDGTLVELCTPVAPADA